MTLLSAARLVAKVARTRIWDERPFILSHLITARCNADCATCLWKMPADSRADELQLHEISALYAEAAALGFRGLVLWGGEPLVRPEAGAALACAAKLGLDTTLITNGYFLHERAHEVLPALRRLLVSVDAVGGLHDDIRRSPGLFERLDRGLEHARAAYPKLSIVLVCVLSRLNAAELEGVARYARERCVRVVFQAMNVTDYGSSDRSLDLDRVLLSPEQERDVAATIAALRGSGFPVFDSSAYLARLGGAAGRYRCHYKKVALRVEPNGDILDCTRKAMPLANVRTHSLAAHLSSEVHRAFIERAHSCNRCRDTGVIEVSHMWEGKVGAFANALASLR